MPNMSYNSYMTKVGAPAHVVRWVEILLIAILLILGGYMIRPVTEWWRGREPKAVAGEYITEVLAGRHERAYSLMTADIRSAQSEDEFRQAMKYVASDTPKLTGGSFIASETVATYTVNADNLVPNEDGLTTATIMVTLVNEDDKWQVDGMDVF